MVSILEKYGLSEEEARQRIQNARENNKRFNNNIDSLRDEYRKKFVAIYNGRIVDSDDDFDVLVRRLKKEHKNLTHVDIEYVPSEDACVVI